MRGHLLKVAEHYHIEIADTKLKESVKSILKEGLVEAGFFQEQENCCYVTGVVSNTGNLKLERQKELLELSLKLPLEIERLRGEKELKL